MEKTTNTDEIITEGDGIRRVEKGRRRRRRRRRRRKNQKTNRKKTYS